MSSLQEETINRCEYFRNVQLWPVANKMDFQGWLRNFQGDDEKHIANILLNFFVYFPDHMVNELLKKNIILASLYIKSRYGDWRMSDTLNNAIFSYMPGQTNHFTDSGAVFARKLRKVFNISEGQILAPNELYAQSDKLKPGTPIIFVDDFVGTGGQTVGAWTDKRFGEVTLGEKLSEHVNIYVPLVCNKGGFDWIVKNCSGLKLASNHILGPEYNIFDKRCSCWGGDESLFEKAEKLLGVIAKKIGIYTYCTSEKDVFGYCKQGLALAFEHGIPDASSAIFYHNSINWSPLYKE